MGIAERIASMGIPGRDLISVGRGGLPEESWEDVAGALAAVEGVGADLLRAMYGLDARALRRVIARLRGAYLGMGYDEARDAVQAYVIGRTSGQYFMECKLLHQWHEQGMEDLAQAMRRSG